MRVGEGFRKTQMVDEVSKKTNMKREKEKQLSNLRPHAN